MAGLSSAANLVRVNAKRIDQTGIAIALLTLDGK